MGKQQTPPGGTTTTTTDDDGGDDEDAAFNARLEKALAGEAFSKAINKVITGREKRSADALKQTVQEAVAAALAASKTPAGDDDGDDGDDDDATTTQTPPRDRGRFARKGMDPEVKRALDAAHRAAEAAKRLAEDEKKKREESEGRAAANEERALLTEALSAAGVQKDMIGVALAYLKEEKKVARAQDGKVVWREGDDEVEVAEGVSGWARSPLGQRFLPPRDTSGSGTTQPMAGKRGAGGKIEYTDADLGNMLKSL